MAGAPLGDVDWNLYAQLVRQHLLEADFDEAHLDEHRSELLQHGVERLFSQDRDGLLRQIEQDEGRTRVDRERTPLEFHAIICLIVCRIDQLVSSRAFDPPPAEVSDYVWCCIQEAEKGADTLRALLRSATQSANSNAERNKLKRRLGGVPAAIGFREVLDIAIAVGTGLTLTRVPFRATAGPPSVWTEPLLGQRPWLGALWLLQAMVRSSLDQAVRLLRRTVGSFPGSPSATSLRSAALLVTQCLLNGCRCGKGFSDQLRTANAAIVKANADVQNLSRLAGAAIGPAASNEIQRTLARRSRISGRALSLAEACADAEAELALARSRHALLMSSPCRERWHDLHEWNPFGPTAIATTAAQPGPWLHLAAFLANAIRGYAAPGEIPMKALQQRGLLVRNPGGGDGHWGGSSTIIGHALDWDGSIQLEPVEFSYCEASVQATRKKCNTYYEGSKCPKCGAEFQQGSTRRKMRDPWLISNEMEYGRLPRQKCQSKRCQALHAVQIRGGRAVLADDGTAQLLCMTCRSPLKRATDRVLATHYLKDIEAARHALTTARGGTLPRTWPIAARREYVALRDEFIRVATAILARDGARVGIALPYYYCPSDACERRGRKDPVDIAALCAFCGSPLSFVMELGHCVKPFVRAGADVLLRQLTAPAHAVDPNDDDDNDDRTQLTTDELRAY